MLPRLGYPGRYPVWVLGACNMKRFSLRTLAIFISVACVFLSLNVVPWRSQWAIYVNGGPSYFPLVDRYGWPYAYLHQYVDELPDDIGGWSVIDNNRLLHVFDNLVICSVLSISVTFMIAWMFKRFKCLPPQYDDMLDFDGASR